VFKSFRFKVLLSISNIPAHTWSVDFVQAVVGSSSLVFEVDPSTLDQSDLSSFLVVVWARHPDLIPSEVCCSMPKPVEPFIEPPPPLFLRSTEIIHSSCDLLHFWVFIRILEVNDINPQVTQTMMDGRPPMTAPVKMTIRATTQAGESFSHDQKSSGVSPVGEAWPSLPAHSDGVWSVAAPAAAPADHCPTIKVLNSRSWDTAGARHVRSCLAARAPTSRGDAGGFWGTE
jgi:hypothetical protein